MGECTSSRDKKKINLNADHQNIRQASLSRGGLEASFGALIPPGFLFLRICRGRRALRRLARAGDSRLPFLPAHRPTGLPSGACPDLREEGLRFARPPGPLCHCTFTGGLTTGKTCLLTAPRPAHLESGVITPRGGSQKAHEEVQVDARRKKRRPRGQIATSRPW